MRTDFGSQKRTYFDVLPIFLNRTNRSGIIRGCVIGGLLQQGGWRLDARFKKRDLISRIERIGTRSCQISLYHLDAADLITDVLPKVSQRTLCYLDPPYYVILVFTRPTDSDRGHVALFSRWMDSTQSTLEMLGGNQIQSGDHLHVIDFKQRGTADDGTLFLNTILSAPGLR